MSEKNIFEDFNDKQITQIQAGDETSWYQSILERVEWYLENDKELLMSYLYRMDVIEHKINTALSQTNTSISEALAMLIYQRQKERIETKLKYKVEPIDEDE